jgi:hypothetical protein
MTGIMLVVVRTMSQKVLTGLVSDSLACIFMMMICLKRYVHQDITTTLLI